ncbi:MAG: Gamma-L-glutamyl-butirosin gamma-glutamyl cyclotransferase, partial [Pseudomonadota bacterium]
MNSENLLFVYGTLLSGLSNHHHMAGATCLGEASVQAALFDLGEYPALCVQGAWAQPLGLVMGELYKIETEQWQRLDKLEEVDPDSLE